MAVSEIDRKTLKSHDYNPLMVVFMQHIITGISVSSLVMCFLCFYDIPLCLG